MELGVFIPIGNNRWLISTASPQYKPSFDLNRDIVQKGERFGFDFALSMIKLHGFSGPSHLGIRRAARALSLQRPKGGCMIVPAPGSTWPSTSCHGAKDKIRRRG